MELVQHVYSVLAISTREKFYTSLRGLLPDDRYSPLCWESDVTSARRLLLERTFDIVVISAPLPDEFGTKLAMHVVDSSSAGVLLLVGAGCCAAQGNGCGKWSRKPPPSRKKWRRSGW